MKTTQKSIKTLSEHFNEAFLASAPIVAVSTPDVRSSIAEMIRTLGPAKTGVSVTLGDEPVAIEPKKVIIAVYEWDAVRGLMPRCSVDDPRAMIAARAADEAANGKDVKSYTKNPVEMLQFAAQLPDALKKLRAQDGGKKEYSLIIFAHNLNRYLLGFGQDDAAKATTSQGVANLRDLFKLSGSMIVIAGDDVQLRGDLRDDSLAFSQPLPNDKRLGEIFDEVFMNDQELIKEGDRASAISGARGLSEFVAEQVFMMATREDHIDVSSMWDTKQELVNKTRGLKLARPRMTFDHIGGMANAKNFMSGLMLGRLEFDAVLWLDEVEKAVPMGSDNNGINDDFVGTLCTYLEDNGIAGVTLVGPPGTGKSQLAEATASIKNVPLIRLDLNDMKESLVGASGGNLRTALKRITAITANKVLLIATSNTIAGMKPELLDRIAALGTIFVDLPTTEEQAEIWPIQMNDFDITEPVPEFDCAGWSGRDIKKLCKLAYIRKETLEQVRAYVVPSHLAAKEKIEELRKDANERYISATAPGVYKYRPIAELAATASAPTSTRLRRRRSEEN